jgi:hypothetical protein
MGAAGTTGANVAKSVGQALVYAAPFTGPAAPFVALAGEITQLLSQLFGGCGQTCILASNDANAVEQKLIQNLNMYLAIPAPRAASAQAAALANFDQVWNTLVQACGQIGGPAGDNCIADRHAGSCKWKASPGGWEADGKYVPAGPAGSGSTCWNWFAGYRDPIANDPHVVPDAQASAAQSQPGISLGTNLTPWLLIGGLILLGVLL